MSIHKNATNDTWYIKYQNTTKRGFTSKKSASLYESKLKLNLIGNENKFMIFDIIEDYLQTINNTITYATYSKKDSAFKNTIMPNIKNKSIFKIDELDCRKFYDYVISLTCSTTHKNYILGLYKAIFKHAMVYFKLKNNPTYVIMPVKKSYEEKLKKKLSDNNIWSVEEFYKFINMVNRPSYNALFTVLYFTGIRVGECLALKWSDFYDGLLDINKSVTKNTNKGSFEVKETKNVFSVRIIDLGQYLTKYLNNYKKEEMKIAGFNDDWFIFGRNKPLPRSTIERIKELGISKANVKRIRLHDFRHSHASNLISNGVNIVAVSKRLGHSDINITLKVYTHLMKKNEDYLIEYINKSSQNLLNK